MAGLNLKRIRPHAGPIAWMALTVLLTIGVVSTLFDLRHVSNAEVLRANESGQRAVVDPATGNVTLGGAKKEADAAFDVGGAPDKKPEEAAPAEGATAEPVAPEMPTQVVAGNDASQQNLTPLRTEPLATDIEDPPSSHDSLVVAPAPEISERVDDRVLPKQGTDGAKAASMYARPFKHGPDQQYLAIVIMDAGLSEQSLPLLLALPKDVTFAFSPYAHAVGSRIAIMRKAGFEVWGMLPTVGEHYPQDDPGPLGLVPSLPKEEVRSAWCCRRTKR